MKIFEEQLNKRKYNSHKPKQIGTHHNCINTKRNENKPFFVSEDENVFLSYFVIWQVFLSGVTICIAFARRRDKKK